MDKIKVADPLADFADRDRAVRDRIRTVEHRGYTRPHFYPSPLAEASALADALRAHCDLLGEMTLAVPGDSVLERVVDDAAFLARLRLHEQKKHLATLQEIAQTAAYATYRDNLRAVA